MKTLCIFDKGTDPYWNLAAEEYLLKEFKQPVFRLWRNDNAIIVGCNQNTLAEIDAQFVKEHNIKVVRRLTGGGAVFHDLGNLNYTFIEPRRYATDECSASERSDDTRNELKKRCDENQSESENEKRNGNCTTRFENPAEMFKRFTSPIIKALNNIGVPAYLQGRNDLLIDGRKFSGNAVCIWHNRVLQHGTLLFASNVADLSGALKARPEKFIGKSVASNSQRVTNISEHLNKGCPSGSENHGTSSSENHGTSSSENHGTSSSENHGTSSSENHGTSNSENHSTSSENKDFAITSVLDFGKYLMQYVTGMESFNEAHKAAEHRNVVDKACEVSGEEETLEYESLAYEPYEYSAEDIAAIEKLAAEKYSQEWWNYGKSPKYTFKNVRKFPWGLVEVYFDVLNGKISNVHIYGDYFSTRPTSELEAQLEGTMHSVGEVEKILERLPEGVEAYFSQASGMDNGSIISGNCSISDFAQMFY